MPDSPTIDVSAAVLAAIELRRDTSFAWPTRSKFTGNNFNISGWSSERTWVPLSHLESLSASGKVWVVGIQVNDLQVISRQNTAQVEVGVHVCFQKLVTDIFDTSEIDPLVTFNDQLIEVCRLEVASYQLQRIEPLRDDEGLPYSYVSLRENNLFESFFTAYYSFIHQ